MRLFIILSIASLAVASKGFAAPLHDAARLGDTTAITELLENGADINQVQVMTPLQMAALNNQLGAVKALIEGGADLDASSAIIGTALHAVAQRGYGEIASALLAAGANADAPNNDGYTPIMIASQNGRIAVVEALIEAGADANAVVQGRGSRDAGGDIKVNALHLATFHGHWEIVEALNGAGARPVMLDLKKAGWATADPERGREMALKFCGNCHIVETTSQVLLKNVRPGPSLIGVLGRPIGTVNGYDYSEALKRADGTWDAELLFSFVAEANLALPGTFMVWNDGWTTEDALQIVAYFEAIAE